MQNVVNKYLRKHFILKQKATAKWYAIFGVSSDKKWLVFSVCF